MNLELSKKQTNRLQSIAILMMLCLHLFNRPYEEVFEPIFFIGAKPLTYYISLFCDACVPVFAFVSGYGLFFKYEKAPTSYLKDNLLRIRKLYMNYWIILIIFVLFLGTLLNKEGYPGTVATFFYNFTGFYTTYNGAWWFLTTYILFVFTSSFWFWLLKKKYSLLLFMFLLLSYFLGAYLKIYKTEIFSNSFLSFLHRQTALYFFTLFQFMLGAYAIKYKWNTIISKRLKKIPNKNYLLLFGMLGLIFLHALIPNIILAPFTALGFIFLFSQFKFSINSIFLKCIDFLAPHTTNIWLIHMFFYLIYFETLIYSPKSPTLIFLWLLLWCVLSSFLINFLNRTILKSLKNKKY